MRAYVTTAVGTVYGEQQSVSPTKATVTTQSITNVNFSAGTATFSGSVTNAGNPAYTERGFVYSTSSAPTINDNKIVCEGSGIGSFSVNATNLPKTSTIYVRAYATSAVGTVYGEQKSVSPTNATVTTQSITNVNFSAGTATFSGSVTNAGNPAYTERGFVYSTSSAPTINDNKIVCEGSGIGSFSVNATNLPKTSTIYVRAYATSAVGTVYGEQKSVSPTNATVTIQSITNVNFSAGTATFTGSISNVGNPAYTERGFAYGTSSNPTIYDKYVVCPGNSSGTYSSNVTGLPTSTIYVRAYVKSELGIEYSTSVKSVSPTMPEIGTSQITNFVPKSGTATFSAGITSVGNPAYTERGFVYGTSENPTIHDTKVVNSGSGTGAYSSNITGLPEGQILYVRAYVINSLGVVYGDNITITPPYFSVPNSNIMVSAESIGTYNWENAKTACNNLVLGGYSDWRLPTQQELYAIYNSYIIKDKYYFWSIDEEASYAAYVTKLSNGTTDWDYKSNNNRVVAVRTISSSSGGLIPVPGLRPIR